MKIVVVGSNGYWGQNHVRTLRNIGAEVITCDLAGEAHFNDYTNIKKCDGVVVATQPQYHTDIAAYFMLNKIPVLIEKPMCLSLEDAEMLGKIHDDPENQTTVLVGHTYLYHPAVDMIKKMIAGGELGTIYYINCNWKNLGLFSKDGVLWDLAPHPLSVILYLADSDYYAAKHTQSAHVIQGVADTASIYLNTGDWDSYLNLSWLDPLKTRTITVVGSKKMVVFDDTEPLDKIKIYDKGCIFHDKASDFGTWQMSYKYGDTVIPKVENKEPLREELEDFMWCIRDRNRKPKSGLQLGARIVQILEGLQKSSG